MQKEVNVTYMTEIKKKDLEKFSGPERDSYLLSKLKEKGFDVTKHIGRKFKGDTIVFIQNRLKSL